MIKQMRIMGKSYKVSTFEPNGIDIVEGISSRPSLYIKYRSDLPLANVNEVLLHEAVHMISDSLSLDLEERQVVGLGIGLYQLLTDNPKLVEIIMNKVFVNKDDIISTMNTLHTVVDEL